MRRMSTKAFFLPHQRKEMITCKSTKFLTDTAQKSQIFGLIYVFREYFLQLKGQKRRFQLK